MEPSARKPHRDWAGYIAERRNAVSGGHNVIVNAEEHGVDASDGKYATICSAHGAIVNTKNLPDARHCMKDATSFCDKCREI